MTHARVVSQVFVIRLHPGDALPPGALCGRLEHVASGRQHDFDTAPALLACLQHEQLQILVAAGAATAIPAGRPTSIPTLSGRFADDSAQAAAETALLHPTTRDDTP